MKYFAPTQLALASLVVACLTGCSSAPQQVAQWADPAVGREARLLRGEKVVIACDAYDLTMQRICEHRLFNEVLAKGAFPVRITAGTALLNDRALDGQLVADATKQGAKAIFTMTLTPANSDAGSGVSLGIGGFSFGRGGGGGIGLSVPVGREGVATGFAASGRVTATGSNRMIWSASLLSSPSSDLDAQFATLSKSMVELAQGAGLF